MLRVVRQRRHATHIGSFGQFCHTRAVTTHNTGKSGVQQTHQTPRADNILEGQTTFMAGADDGHITRVLPERIQHRLHGGLRIDEIGRAHV